MSARNVRGASEGVKPEFAQVPSARIPHLGFDCGLTTRRWANVQAGADG